MKTFIQIVIAGLLNVAAVLDATAQVKSSTKPVTYLLPDGSVLQNDKLDSLIKAWGQDRFMVLHNKEDDDNGIVRLGRMTDEMMQEKQAEENEKKKALAGMLNKPAPDFELEDMQGNCWSLQNLRGKIVVLNFWFTSCSPCIKEMPELNELVRTYDSSNVVFLGLTYNNAEQVSAFLKRRVFNYTLLPNSSGVDSIYQISSWPTSIVIDKDGNIKKIIGSSPKILEELSSAINALN